MFPAGSIGSELAGRRLRVFDAYVEAKQAAASGQLEAQEAMSTSDFPTYIGSFLRHRFLERFQELTGQWPQYTGTMSVEDFEEYTSSRFGRFPDISRKPLNGPYDELAIIETPGPRVQLYEWGNSFALTRQLVISDRLGQMGQLPNLLADALARTMSKNAVQTIEGNPLMYDGNALFSAPHANLGSTALTSNTTGMALIQSIDLALRNQKDDEGYPITSGAGGATLLIPPSLRWVARAINENELVPDGSNNLIPNEVRGYFTNVIEDPFLTDANNWYVFSSLGGGTDTVVQVNLNGNTTPFLGVANPEVRGILGGDDPYTFDFDEIRYKIRHDFSFRAIEWRYVYGNLVP